MKPSLTINLVFLSTPSVPILLEKTSTPITYLGRSTHCVRGVNKMKHKRLLFDMCERNIAGLVNP